jgi:predicted DNA-binding transcriptional regulator AlpA
MARQGRIPARKIGQRVRFMSDEIEAWFNALPKAGK